MKREKKTPIVGIEFETVSVNDVMPLILNERLNAGRFGALKEGVLEQVQKARKNQSIVFLAPLNSDTKELSAIRNAVTGALKKAGENWAVRYSEKEKKFIIIHRGRMTWKGANRVSKTS